MTGSGWGKDSDDLWSKGSGPPSTPGGHPGQAVGTETTFTDVEQAQGELSLARVALSEGDLKHAANHVAGAIGYAPALPEIHELLAALAARSDDGGVGLFPVEQSTYIGTVVGQAHLLSPRDPARALSLLSQATAFDPSKPWADVAWVRACTTEGIDPDALGRVFVNVIGALNEPVPDEVRHANSAYLELAQHALAAHPDHAVLHGVCSAVARRLGDPAVAVAWGRRGVELESNKMTLTWYAYALRTAGRLDDALDVMHRARRDYPLDIDLSADASSWLADAGRLGEALAIIEDAVRADPTYDCGVHTLHRLRFRRDGDAATHLVALSDFVRSETAPSHEHTDLPDCCRGEAWLGQPAWATESTINALRQVPAEQRTGGGTMHVSQMEVPSALAVTRRVWPGLEIGYPDPTPDLATPLRAGPPLWRFDGKRLVPGVPPPSAPAASLLSRTVTPWWPHPVALYDQALPLGDLSAQDLVASLVHPPPCPADYPDLTDDWWVRSIQAFACVGLLHCRELTSPGDTRRARELLTQLAYGIEDWVTEAALFGLAVAAWADPACRTEVARTVADRYAEAARATSQHVVTIMPGLARLLGIVPGIDDGLRAHARDVIAYHDREDEDEPGS